MSRSFDPETSRREFLVLMLILLAYLAAGAAASASFLPHAASTILPGTVLVALCWLRTSRHPLQDFLLYKGRRTDLFLMAAYALILLFTLLRPVSGSGTSTEFGLIFCLVVVAPMAEELFFRGLLFDHFSRNLGGLAALLLSALLFGGLHYDRGHVVPMMVLGLMAGAAALKTKSVAAAVAVHVCWNACAVLNDAGAAERPRILLVALAPLAALYLYGRSNHKVSHEPRSTEAVSPSA